MQRTRVLLTGFGPFESVVQNPSGALARDLDGLSRAGAQIVGAVLPVSFERAPRELEALVARARPDVVLATGVHPGPGFRIERGAGVELRPARADVDGVCGEHLPERRGRRLESDFDLERLGRALGRSGSARVETSDDAGQYVCECVYRRVLELGVERGPRGVFVHLPSFESVAPDVQRAGMLALIDDLVQQLA